MGIGTPGRLSKVTLGADGEIIIGGISKHTYKQGTKDIDDSEYPQQWEKCLAGSKNWSGSVEGKMRSGDAGQAALEADADAGVLGQDIRFYFGETRYHKPDLDADPDAGVLITNLEFGNDLNGVVTVKFDYKGSGPVKKVVV